MNVTSVLLRPPSGPINVPPPSSASQTGFRINIAVSFLLIYEHLITLDNEVKIIWTLPWRLPRILFLINRYITPPFLIILFLVQSFDILTDKFCEDYAYWQVIPTRLALITAELIIIIRVCAIYGNEMWMIVGLGGLFVVEATAVIVLAALASANVYGVQQHPGCIMIGSDATLTQWAAASWICPLVFETVVVLVTLYKVVPWPTFSWARSSRPKLPLLGVDWRRARISNPIIRVLARDSLIYFGCMFVITLSNSITFEIGPSSKIHSGTLIGPSSAVACIAVGRMMINVKEASEESRHGAETGFDISDIQFNFPDEGQRALPASELTGEVRSEGETSTNGSLLANSMVMGERV